MFIWNMGNSQVFQQKNSYFEMQLTIDITVNVKYYFRMRPN